MYLLLFVAQAACTGRWRDVDALAAKLRCGMTVQDVKNVAKRYSDTIVYPGRGVNLPDLVIQHGATNVDCYFDSGKLTAIQITWISEPARRKVEPRKELCQPSPP